MKFSRLPRSRLIWMCVLVAALPAISASGADSKGKAVDDEKKAQGILGALKPGEVATSANGFSMKAKLNGKEWVATSMMSFEETGRLIGSRKDEYISFPFRKNYMVVDKTLRFGESRAVDLALDDSVGIWGGRTGEMKITRVDNNVVEGTFFFTATANGTSEKIEVTDGTFRLLLGKK